VAESDDKSNDKKDLGPEITGTLLVAGRPTASGTIYSRKLLCRVAANPELQQKIRTFTFLGKVRRPARAAVDVEHVSLREPAHSVTHLGVEGNELRVVTRLLPMTFPDKRVMSILPDAVKAGTAAFVPVGDGSVDENGIVGANYKLDRIDLVILEHHDVELPERYVPKKLGMEQEQVDTVRPILYGIGIEHKPNDFGMTHGLATDVKDMLEVVPDETFEPSHGERVCLLRFNSDGTDEILYVWRGQAWHREKR
jgi:hypothetical protein